MSSQALNELKDLEVTLQSLAAGVPTGASEAGTQSYAQKPSAIISANQLDPKNPWGNYLLIQKLIDTAYLPTKSNDLDAGYDLYAFCDTTVGEWSSALVSTKISIGIPPNTYGRIASRSGLSVNHNLEVGAGVVDRGYTGEIIVVLRNFSDIPYKIKRGDKIAQLILEQYRNCPIKQVRSIQDVMGMSTRGALGFGSSGR